jgi:hypothetical protein
VRSDSENRPFFVTWQRIVRCSGRMATSKKNVCSILPFKLSRSLSFLAASRGVAAREDFLYYIRSDEWCDIQRTLITRPKNVGGTMLGRMSNLPLNTA